MRLTFFYGQFRSSHKTSFFHRTSFRGVDLLAKHCDRCPSMNTAGKSRGQGEFPAPSSTCLVRLPRDVYSDCNSPGLIL